MGYRITFIWYLSALLLYASLALPAVAEEAYLPLVKVAEPIVLSTNGGLEGWVELEFWVSKTGDIRNIVVKKATHSELESAAIAAVQEAAHLPYEKDGQILEQHVFQSVHFSNE
jgi:TonB family protein